MTEDKIKCLITVEKKIRYVNSWGLIKVSLDKVLEGDPKTDKYNCFTLKGCMPEPIVGMQYMLCAKLERSKQYGDQYQILSMSTHVTNWGKEEQKKYLAALFTPTQIKAMYKALDNPFDSFCNGKLEDLVKIRGCGMISAPKWLEKFNKELPNIKIRVELNQFDLSDNVIKRLMNTYKSADVVIQKINENPYSLIEVNGIGWHKADQIVMSSGMDKYSINRLRAFIFYFLSERGNEGFSYIHPDELMDAIIENIGEDVPNYNVSEAIYGLSDKLWWNKEKTKIGLQEYRDLEEKIGKELIRLLKAENNFRYTNWEEIIQAKEFSQGWQYIDQQLEGIKQALEQQVIVIHGLAGTGKTSLADGILDVLKGYSVALCALSGRASSRIAEVTNGEGYTIHRLLKYPDTSEYAKDLFTFHDNNRLPYDIIIIDEISMVDGYLFYYLIRAIKSGSKLIILGDIGQLESLGSLNIAADLINSNHIPTVCLNQIHRQAKASAIISESNRIRQGIQIIPKDWVGKETRGELQDLVIDCYSDKSNTFYKVMQYFSEEMSLVNNIMDLQVIVPVKNLGDASTWVLNNTIQEIYNPTDETKKEIEVSYTSKQVGILRIGDKVINTKNNYRTQNKNGANVPIYNGNLGIITDIDLVNEKIVVDFLGLGEVCIDKAHVKSIELGYAITIHKAQGSQFPRVIIGIDYMSYALLTKELLYTAITRAQKHCTLVAQNSALRYGASQNNVNKKRTHLVEILDDLVIPKLVF